MTVTAVNPAAERHRHVPAAAMPATLLRSVCDLEVIIPAYNEERRLPATLVAMVEALSALEHLTSRIVIVDNGSSDRTSDVVDQLARDAGPEIVVVGCSTPGKGAAVRRGIVTSQARMVGFADADLSVPTHVIGQAVTKLGAGADVVIASRRCLGASYEVLQPRFRRMGSWAFRTSIKALVPGVSDSQCGFKFFSLAAARRIFNDVDLAGFAFDVEVLMRAARHGYAVTELPVAWSDDSESTLGLMSHAPEIARDIVRLHRIDAQLARRNKFAPTRTVRVARSTVGSVSDSFAALHAARVAAGGEAVTSDSDALRVA